MSKAFFEIQINSVYTDSLVNKLRQMFHDQKKLGDTRSDARKPRC